MEAGEAIAIEAALARGASRERLLEILLDVRDGRGGIGISEAGLRTVAERLRLLPSEAYEVATAFPAVNYQGTTPYGNDTDGCDDLVCALLRADPGRDRAGCGGVCRGRCDRPEGTLSPRSFTAFRAAGGYGVLDALRRDPAEGTRILERLAAGHAVGRAGVGFPVARKWRSVMASGTAPVVIVNGDEGELAVFKDRFILESDPHGVIEAALVAARVTGADRVFIYVRDDYVQVQAILRRAIAEVTAAGPAEGVAVELRRSGGAYICGEETALIASLEGRPARPRERPPYPTERGYLGRPTLVHNVETFYRLRAAWGAPWGAAPEAAVPVSALLDPEVVLHSVSGRVRAPGPKLVRALPTLEALVDAAGGMAQGQRLGGMVVGGSAGTIVPAELCGAPLADLIAAGLKPGTGGAIVFGAGDDRRWIAARMAAFLARESCGQCAPCRVGTTKAARALAAEAPLDGRLVDDLAAVMAEASICALGRNAGRFLGRLRSVLPEIAQ